MKSSCNIQGNVGERELEIGCEKTRCERYRDNMKDSVDKMPLACSTDYCYDC